MLCIPVVVFQKTSFCKQCKTHQNSRSSAATPFSALVLPRVALPSLSHLLYMVSMREERGEREERRTIEGGYLAYEDHLMVITKCQITFFENVDSREVML